MLISNKYDKASLFILKTQINASSMLLCHMRHVFPNKFESIIPRLSGTHVCARICLFNNELKGMPMGYCHIGTRNITSQQL